MSKHPKLQAFNLNQWLDTNREREVFTLPSHTVHAPQRFQKDSIGIVIDGVKRFLFSGLRGRFLAAMGQPYAILPMVLPHLTDLLRQE